MALSHLMPVGASGSRSADEDRPREAEGDEEMRLLDSDVEATSGGTVVERLAALSVHRGVFAAFCIAACMAVAALAGATGIGHAAAPAAPLASPATARSLLESDELTDITTRNLIAFHGEGALRDAAGGRAVRDRVAAGLREVGRAIEDRLPEAHRQMAALQVTPQQQVVALDAPRRLGDARMVNLARDVAGAARENAAAGGGHEDFERRLADRLQTKISDIRELSQELFPEGRVAADVSVPDSSMLNKWNPRVEVDFGRRLSSSIDDVINAGVRVHAQTMLESLQRQLGDHMPTAPARMLSFFDEPSSSSSSSSGSGGSGEQSFMSCVAAAVPDPSKVCKCIADNMADVISMVKKFLMGKK